MTDEQIAMIRALSVVTFVPGAGTKRFARDMGFMAANQPGHELTPKQAEYLRTAVIRFRRQIPHDVVETAKRLEPRK